MLIFICYFHTFIAEIDNIGDLVPPVAVFWYRRFTLSDFS